MKMLVTMVKEADKREDEDKYGYFYDFLTSFNMYAQTLCGLTGSLQRRRILTFAYMKLRRR